MLLLGSALRSLKDGAFDLDQARPAVYDVGLVSACFLRREVVGSDDASRCMLDGVVVFLGGRFVGEVELLDKHVPVLALLLGLEPVLMDVVLLPFGSLLPLRRAARQAVVLSHFVHDLAKSGLDEIVAVALGDELLRQFLCEMF